jgi:hypothetical protein
MSPASIASAASATNWRLVNPCSTVRLVASAASTQSALSMMSSKKLRTASTPHSLVWNAFWAQSKRGSCLSSSCEKRRSSWVCLVSSSIPNTPRLRYLGVGANRQNRLCMVTAMYSIMQVPPMCRCDAATCAGSSFW